MYMDAYLRSIHDPDEFWGEIAEQMIHWDKPFEKVLDNSNEPFTKWFVGGHLNACYNSIDRHIQSGLGNKVAIIHESPMTNTMRRVTYTEMYDTVSTRIENTGLTWIKYTKNFSYFLKYFL